MSLIALGACMHLDVPLADNYPASAQQKMRSAHHWDVLAADLVKQIAPRVSAGKQVNFEFSDRDSEFATGLRTLLLSHLSKEGIVFSTEAGALTMQVQTQVVSHAVPRPSGNKYPFTSLGVGVSVWRDILTHLPLSEDAIKFNWIGAGVLADISRNLTRRLQEGRASGGPTGIELLVSTALHDGARSLAHTADIYYIEQADAELYRYKPPLPPPPPPSPQKIWEIVNK